MPFPLSIKRESDPWQPAAWSHDACQFVLPPYPPHQPTFTLPPPFDAASQTHPRFGHSPVPPFSTDLERAFGDPQYSRGSIVADGPDSSVFSSSSSLSPASMTYPSGARFVADQAAYTYALPPCDYAYSSPTGYPSPTSPTLDAAPSPARFTSPSSSFASTGSSDSPVLRPLPLARRGTVDEDSCDIKMEIARLSPPQQHSSTLSKSSSFGKTARAMPFRTGVTPFASKLFWLLDHPQEFGDCIRWSTDGRAFLVAIESPQFNEQVLPDLFLHTSLSSFLRQLQLYSFTRLSTAELQDALGVYDPALTSACDWRGFTHASHCMRRGDPSQLHMLKPRISKARATKKALRNSSISSIEAE